MKVCLFFVECLLIAQVLAGTKEDDKNEDSEENYDDGSAVIGGGGGAPIFSPTERPSTGGEVTSFPQGGAPPGVPSEYEVDDGSTTDEYTQYTPPTVNPVKITSTVAINPRPAPVYVLPVITQSILVGDGCFSRFGKGIKARPNTVSGYNKLLRRLKKCLKGRCNLGMCNYNLKSCLYGAHGPNMKYDCYYKWYLCAYKKCDHRL